MQYFKKQYYYFLVFVIAALFFLVSKCYLNKEIFLNSNLYEKEEISYKRDKQFIKIKWIKLKVVDSVEYSKSEIYRILNDFGYEKSVGYSSEAFEKFTDKRIPSDREYFIMDVSNQSGKIKTEAVCYFKNSIWNLEFYNIARTSQNPENLIDMHMDNLTSKLSEIFEVSEVPINR